MKIIYLVIGELSAGVLRKVEDKIRFMRMDGLDVDLAYTAPQRLSRNRENLTWIHADYALSNWLAKKPIIWRLSVIVEQWITYTAIQKFLRLHKFDYILFRYPIADFFLVRLMRRIKGKIVFEHNTLEREELEMRKSGSFWYSYFYLSERLFGKSARRLAKGIVGVTEEITKRQIAIANRDIAHTTISNGIDVNRVKNRSQFPFDGSTLNLLFLAGSPAPWHGISKLLNGLNKYNGNCSIHCFIAGNIEANMAKEIKENQSITLLPTQTEGDLDKLVDRCHIGIGSLGIVKFLKEACPLKVREYWARGLPFVIGYDDSDLLANADMHSNYLQVDLSVSDFLDLHKVVSFAHAVYSESNVSVRMRKAALQRIHYQSKADQYVRFFKSL